MVQEFTEPAAKERGRACDPEGGGLFRAPSPIGDKLRTAFRSPRHHERGDAPDGEGRTVAEVDRVEIQRQSMDGTLVTLDDFTITKSQVSMTLRYHFAPKTS